MSLPGSPMNAPGPSASLNLTWPVSLGVYNDYAHAQKTVDTLSDRGFPVQNCMIVGTDLRQVERVTGRLTPGKVVGAGALSGAWLGLLVGLLMSLFDEGGWTAVPPSILIGALFGMVWAWFGYSLTRGQRDFTSVSRVVATRYEVLVEHSLLAQARSALAGENVPAGEPAEQPPAGGATAAPGPMAPPSGTPYADVPAPDGVGASVPEAPAPQYRTYGEAMDAQRRAEEAGTAEPPAPSYPHTPESLAKETPPPNPRD